MLKILGTLGLVLIVLEATLHLKVSRGALPVLFRAFFSALTVFSLTALAIAALLNLWTGRDWLACLVNAIPFAVISSAVAIPGSQRLLGMKRDFIVYESTFSDIIGISAFSFFAYQAGSPDGMFSQLIIGSVSALGLALAIALMLMLFLPHIPHHGKYSLMLSLLLLLFSLGKILHMSSLLIIFFFGIFLSNWESIRLGRFFPRPAPELMQAELGMMQFITIEASFITRSFFFVLFGFSVALERIGRPILFLQTGILLAIILLVRFLYLRIAAKVNLFPELFIAPRGLITLPLFYGIPAPLLLPGITEDLLFVLILASGIIMTISLMVHNPGSGGLDAAEEAEVL